MAIEDLLNQYKSGTLDLADALTGIRAHYFEDIGHTIIDHDRKRRTGAGEVIFGEGKSADQIADIISSLQAKNSNILVTRLHPDKYAALTDLPQNASYHSNAQLLSWHAQPPQSPSTSIAVVTAGTSDINVAEEAALTAEFFGNPVTRIFDVGGWQDYIAYYLDWTTCAKHEYSLLLPEWRVPCQASSADWSISR